MKLLKQAMALLGTVVVIAVIAALVTPKTAHALVATLVQVANTASQPVPTWRTDNEGRNVVRLDYSETMNNGVSGCFGPTGAGNPMYDASTVTVYTVPAGKRLVIDNISLFAYPPIGQKVFAYFWNGYTFTAFPEVAQGTFPAIFSGTGTQDWFQNAIAVRDYVEPGGQYLVTIQRSASTSAMSWFAWAVGHLVDCTNGGGC